MAKNYPNRRYSGPRQSSGYQKSKNNKNNSGKGQNTERELKFHPNSYVKQNSATYATVKEAIIMNIQRYFKYGYEVSKFIEDEQVIDIKAEEPSRDISRNTDETERSIEQDRFNIKYQ